MRAFPPEVIREIGYYVYRLIDPRTGETFYVGKGRANRVFQHALGEPSAGEDDLSDRLSRIREIRLCGLEVQHVIHRHGLDERTAFEVEAALMDAFSGLTNLQVGHGGDERGIMHAVEIVDRYQAREAEIRHKLLIITINRTAEERSVYNAVRFAWKVDPRKARGAEYVLAAVRGVIKGVFVADRWLPATVANFPEFGLDRPRRWGFEGRDAPPEIQSAYFNTRISDRLRRPGAANPIRHISPE